MSLCRELRTSLFEGLRNTYKLTILKFNHRQILEGLIDCKNYCLIEKSEKLIGVTIKRLIMSNDGIPGREID